MKIICINCDIVFIESYIKKIKSDIHNYHQGVYDVSPIFRMNAKLQWTSHDGKSTFFRLLAVKDEWFSDDLRRLDDDNVYRKLQGHWIIEMSEMIATANAKSIEEIKSFLSKQKETYKVPYETHPA